MNGIDRLKKLAEGQEDPSLNRVINYLVDLTEMDVKYLSEEKSLKGMIDYIKAEAKKIAKDGYCWVEDATVFNWSKIYWDKTNDELGIKKKEVVVPKVKAEIKKEVVPEVQKYGQLALF